MRVLILGGSFYFGRLLAKSLRRLRFDVTLFNRGRTTAPVSDGIQYIRADRKREDHLQILAKTGSWDVVIDLSGKIPAVVQRSVRAAAEIADRYIFLSSIEVYRDWPHMPVDETSPLLLCHANDDPGDLTPDRNAYGLLKAGCEAACRDTFEEARLLILRLHITIGTHEHIGPLRAWLQRMQRGGQVLVPAPDGPIQPVDVRDVVEFLVNHVEKGTHGVFNIAAPASGPTYGSMMRMCADAALGKAATMPELVWVNGDWLIKQGLKEWTDLPLWRNASAAWHVNVNRAIAAGLRCRPLEDTIMDAWRCLQTEEQLADQRGRAQYGLSPAREESIIAHWQARGFND